MKDINFYVFQFDLYCATVRFNAMLAENIRENLFKHSRWQPKTEILNIKMKMFIKFNENTRLK